MQVPGTAGTLPIACLLLLLLLLLATACGPLSAVSIDLPAAQPTGAALNPTVTQTPEPTVATPQPTDAPSTPGLFGSASTPSVISGATIASTPLPMAGASPSATENATATGAPGAQDATAAATISAIKSVIQKANDEEVQAFAASDPIVMADTATTTYYEQLVQNYNSMVSAGITLVQLLDLAWGDITLQSASTVQVYTSETWQTTLADGSTVQETDVNIYTLVLQDGSWKVQDDQHPNARTLQTQPTTPSTPSIPGTPGTVGAVPTVTTTPGATPGAATPVAALIPAGTNVDQSTNWSGYMATGGPFTAITGTWTVPGVSAGSGNTVASDATWVGIGGTETTDLIQAGTMTTVQGGQVEYAAWWETLPQAAQIVPLDVAAGDKVSVSIAQQPDGTWQIVIRDDTSGQQFQKSLTYRSSLSSAEWIEEAPTVGRGALVPLDDFGAVTFTAATTLENGQEHTIGQASGQPVAMYSSTSPSQGRFRARGRTAQTTQAGQLLAQPSALGVDGASFSVTRTNVPAPVVVP